MSLIFYILVIILSIITFSMKISFKEASITTQLITLGILRIGSLYCIIMAVLLILIRFEIIQ